MKFLDKLKDIIKIDIDLSKFISSNSHNINIHVSDREVQDKIEINEDDKKIIINLLSFEQEERKKLAPALKEVFDDKVVDQVIEDGSEKRVRDIKEKSQDSSVKRILSFYEGKISLENYRCLESALYIRALFKEKKPRTQRGTNRAKEGND